MREKEKELKKTPFGAHHADAVDRGCEQEYNTHRHRIPGATMTTRLDAFVPVPGLASAAFI